MDSNFLPQENFPKSNEQSSLGMSNMHNSMYNNSSMPGASGSGVQYSNIPPNGIHTSDPNAPPGSNNSNIYNRPGSSTEGIDPNHLSGGQQSNSQHMGMSSSQHSVPPHPGGQMPQMSNYNSMPPGNGMMNMSSGPLLSGNTQMQPHNMSQQYVNMHGQQGMIPQQQQQQMMQPGMMMNGMPNNQPGDVGLPRQMLLQNSGVPMGQQMPQSIPQSMQMMYNMNMSNGMAPSHMNPQQPQMTAQGSSGLGNAKIVKKSWHNTDHVSIRASMVEKIISLLKQRRPNASDDWHEKLPHMAKRLEEALYGQADSLEQYSDATTLKIRLQQLALSMGGSKQSNAPRQMTDSQGRIIPGPMPGQPIQYQNQSMGSTLAPGSNTSTNQFVGPPITQQQMQQGYLMNGQPSNGQYNMHMYPNSMNPQHNTMHNNMGYQNPGSMDPQHYNNSNQNPSDASNMDPHALAQRQQQMAATSGSSMMNNNMPPQYPGMTHIPQGMNQQGMGMSGKPDDRSMQMQGRAAPYSSQQPMGNMQSYHNVSMQQGGNVSSQMPQQMNNNQQQMMNQQQQMMNQQQQVYNMPHANGNYSQPGNMGMPQNQQMMVSQPGGMMPMNHTSMNSQMPSGGQSSQSMNTQVMTQGIPGSQNPSHTEEHRRQVLKQQQQRLLLLRHASKCPHETGRCTVTPHCANMKILWKHIMSCKDQECKVAHCVSSRYVLSHYSKCKDQQCPVCGPVREAIRRNYERSKEQIEIGNKNMAMQGGRSGGRPGYDDHDNSRRGYRGNNQAIMGGHDMMISQPPAKPKPIYPLDHISCAVYSFSQEQIAAHFKSIHEGMRLSAAKIKESFLPLIDEILRLPNANSVFGYPVDPVALGLPDYNNIVKMPMDLGTIRKRLETCSYRDVSNLVFDVHLTFNNATAYNLKGSDVHSLAKVLKKEFDNRHRTVMNDIERHIELARDHPDSCLICGEIKLLYEPPVYYCNGRCGGQRIRRAATFYSTKTNNYHWCNQCFNELKDSSPIRLPDCTVYKSELVKKKHNEDSEEPWVQCDGPCERWVHQICGLFNGRRNTGDECKFVCPNCLTNKRRQALPNEIIIAPTTKKMKATDLPHCNLSQFLEKRIYERLDIAYKETAAKRNMRVEDVEKCPALVLRQVSCYDKMQHVREGVFERYKSKNYPAEFACRTKCLILFQNIDGQDVILFGMYVYEYGHRCPPPNQRRVYISYLDSVHYFRPKQYRTLVYHEILISYLDYVKARGFHTAHIWACPPQKGDDYILYVHPPDQKTPRPDKLRNWYQDMLLASKARGIVHEISDLHTEFMADQTNDATVLPYFEGDYWVNEAEVIIKDLSNPGVGIDDNVLDDEAGKSKRKSKNKRAGRVAKSLPITKAERDPLMAKLSNMIEPMKDTFFVVRLHPKEYADQCANQRQVELLAESSEGKQNIEETKAKELRDEALSDNIVTSDIPNIPTEEQKAADGSSSSNKEDAGDHPSNDDNDDGDDAFSALAAGVSTSPMPDEDGNNTSRQDSSQLKLSSASVDDMSIMNDVANMESDNNTESNTEKAASSAVDDDMETSSTNSGVRSKKRKADHMIAGLSKIPRDVSSSNPSHYNDTTNNESSETTSASESYTMAETKEPDHDPIPSPSKSMNDAKSNDEGKDRADESNAMIARNSSDESQAGDGNNNDNAENSGSSYPREHQAYTGMFSAVPIERDDTEDVDDVQESEHFDTRQSVLNLCQGNHYQFDQLRRAKHTSLMVLYHIHNPDAPKFVPSCHNCHKDILVGVRYHCDTCDVDFCSACFSPRVHHHPLQPISVSGGNQPKKLTKEQLRERQRSIQLHMQLLQHAANCADNIECKSRNCAKMKEFLKHDAVCQIKAAKGCRTCLRINNLLQLHARSCRQDACRVPHCLEIREHYRQIELQQQQMDDRRRTMINEKYRSSAAGAVSRNDDD